MSLIITPRWARQPAPPVELSRGHPLAAGFWKGFADPRRLVFGDARFSPSGAVPAPTADGLAVVSASGSWTLSYATPGSPQTTAITLLVRAVRFGAQPDSGFGTALFSAKTGGTSDPFDWFIKDAGERVRLNTGTSDSTGNYWETADDWPVGRWQTGVVTWESGGAPVIYRDGRALTLSFSGGTLTGTLKAGGDLSLNLAALRLNGAVSAVYIYRRALSAAEVRALSANPWQIWARPRRLWAFSTGASVPTVSPSGIATAEAFGTPTFSWRTALAAAGIASAEAFGTPTFSWRTALATTGIASAEAFGTPTFSWRTTINVTGIPSAEAFGTPVLTRDGLAALIRRSSMLAIRLGINL